MPFGGLNPDIFIIFEILTKMTDFGLVPFLAQNLKIIPPRKLKFGMNVASMVQICLLGV